MIHRDTHLKTVERLLRSNPVVALLGARQVGKTTLARQITKRRRSPVHFFDLDLRSLDVIHAGDETFPLAGGIRAVAAVRMLEDL